jgi:hypothetical protein
MKTMSRNAFVIAVIALMCAGTAHAFQFQASDSVKGSLDMQLTLGAGMRLLNPNPGMLGDPRFGGTNTAQWSNGDDGDLNYKRGDLFSTYLKFTPELLLKFPDNYKFMARGTALYDFKATDTRRTDLADEARDQVARDVRILDLWVSKDMNIGSQRARVRVGNQVISWGESIFAIGGINSTNALDFQKFTTPGTQIKEAVIPAPIVSIASGLGKGINAEAYYQFWWSSNRVPPVGTYFSAADIFGKGRQPLFVDVNPASRGFVNFGGLDAAASPGDPNVFPVPFLGDKTPKNGGQYGAAIHYKPEGISLDVGFYFMNYHDKMPVLETTASTAQWIYLEDRKMYGVSANFPVGNWAVGWELSYRPKDAVALTGCFADPNGPLDLITNAAAVAACPQWIDQKKFQTHLTGILSLTPGDHGWILDLFKADTATFTGEAVMVRYPGISPDKRFTRDIGGVQATQAPLAAYGFWKGPPIVADIGGGPTTFDTTASVGTANSYGYTVDFNWAYDNKLIRGWTVIPGVTWFQAVKGDTPTLTANYLQGAKSANVYILFNQSAPTRWQAGLNYTSYWGGGADHLRQPLGDRDFVGGFLTRNF